MRYVVPRMAVMPSRITIDADPAYRLSTLSEVRPVPYTVPRMVPTKTINLISPELDTESFS